MSLECIVRAVLYARVSTYEQTEGYSLDAQIGYCREYCEGQGWEVVSEYVDPGFSGRSARRPQFEQMMKDAKAGLLDIVVVHKLDRFARSLRDTLNYLHRLDGWGISFVSIVEAFDFTTPHGKLQMQILAAIAEWYSNNLGQEVIKGQTVRARRGLPHARVPFGYRNGEEGVGEPYEPEAEVVRQMFDMYASGRHTGEQIAAELNRAGYLAPSGRSWYDAGVMAVVKNSFYMGMVRYQGKSYPGKHKPLVSKAIFEQCQEVRKERGIHTRSGSPKLRVYTLAGIAHCCECKRRLYCLFSGKYLYYRCRSMQRGGRCSQSKGVIRADLLEDQVGEIIKSIELLPDWRTMVLEHLQVKGEDVERYQRERSRLEEKLRRIRVQYREVEISEEEYRRELKGTKQRLASLNPPQEMQAEAILQAGRYLETLGPIWEAATPQERKEIYQLVLEVVYVDVLEKKLVQVRPKGAFAPLFGDTRLD